MNECSADVRNGGPKKRPHSATLRPTSGEMPLLDTICIFACSIISILISTGFVPPQGDTAVRYLGLTLAVAILFQLGATAKDLYGSTWVTEKHVNLFHLLLTWTGVVLGVYLLLKSQGRMEDGESIFILSLFFLSSAALSSCRWIRSKFRAKFRSEIPTTRGRIVLLTDIDHSRSSSLVSIFERADFDVVSVISLTHQPSAPSCSSANEDVQFAKVLDLVNLSDISEIIVTMHSRNLVLTGRAVDALRHLNVPIRFAPNPDLKWILKRDTTDIGETQLVEILQPSNQIIESTLKRFVDFTGAAGALLLLSPLMMLIALAIRIDSPGPILFRQARAGLRSQPFYILKFRTMNCLEDGARIRQARRGDDRVTRVGRILRRLSLDELPQLANVVRGEMSLVGPRPHAIAHDLEYGPQIESYAARYSVKPGITGWAQINGCRGETAQVAEMQRRIDYDLAYIRQWSNTLDLCIILATIREVFRSDHAY